PPRTAFTRSRALPPARQARTASPPARLDPLSGPPAGPRPALVERLRHRSFLPRASPREGRSSRAPRLPPRRTTLPEPHMPPFRQRKPAPGRRPTRRPVLEALEDRLLPSGGPPVVSLLKD